MAIDMDRVEKGIRSHLLQEHSLTSDMSDLIDVCEQGLPHPDWRRLRELAYDDLADLETWIIEVFDEEPPAMPLAGLWFGLFNPIYDVDPTADLYVAGAFQVDLDESDIDWAGELDYVPDRAYAHSAVLHSIYEIAHGGQGGLQNEAEYPLGLAYGAFAAKRLLQRLDPRCIVSDSRKVLVTVGFDSGDYLHLGHLTAKGLELLKQDGDLLGLTL